MFIPIEQMAWPSPGEARELRFSLNAPVLLGPGGGSEPTRAALGWLPAGSGAVVRLWLRADGAPQAVRAFDLPECPMGPGARGAALERAERLLSSLGFLFPEIQAPCRLGQDSPAPVAETSTPETRTSDPNPAVSPALAPQTEGPAIRTATAAGSRTATAAGSRTATAAGPRTATVVRAGVRLPHRDVQPTGSGLPSTDSAVPSTHGPVSLTKFRRRSPNAEAPGAIRPGLGRVSPTGGTDR